MRIDRLDLLAWGPFTDHVLDLSAGQFGLHLIHGDNEAGKSTTLRALIAWLFGIPARTGDNHLHDNSRLRIGGKLRAADQRELEFIRKKGNKNTLLNPGDQKPMEDASLAAFLPPGLDETLFCKLWGIDHERLVSGGNDLLEQSGDLGQALFSAATGTANLRTILKELSAGADELFKPRASKATVNHAISEYKNAMKTLRETSLPISEWKNLQKELQEVLEHIRQVDLSLAEKQKILSQLERIRRVRPGLAQRRNLLAQLENLSDVILLPEDFTRKVQSAHAIRLQATESAQRLVSRQTHLQKEAELLNVRADLLDNEDEILSIYRELGAAEKTLADRPQQDGKRRLLRNEAETLLKCVLPDATLEDAESLRPLLNRKRLIGELAKKSEKLTHEQDQLEEALRDLQDEQSSKEQQLQDIAPAGLDIDRLKAAVAQVRKAGDVEQRLSELQKQVEQENAACTLDFKRLGRYGGDLPSVLELSLPVAETLDRFEREEDALLEEGRTLERKKRETEDHLRRVEADLRELLDTGAVPTEADLNQSRQDRNDCWQYIRSRYVHNQTPKDDPAGYGADPDLPGTFETRIRVADDLSDTLRKESDRVVRRVELDSSRENLQLELQKIATDAEDHHRSLLDHRTRWSAIWEAPGIEAGTPREMKQWLLRMERLIEKLQAAQSLAGQHESLRVQCESLRDGLLQWCAPFGDESRKATAGLEMLVSLCEEKIRHEESLLESRQRLAHDLNQIQIRLQRALEKRKAQDTSWKTWNREWEKAICGLGVAPDAPTDLVTETFEKLVQFFEKFDKSDDIRKRIYGMDKVKEDFEQRVNAFADLLSFPKEGRDAFAIAGQLHRELNQAREARATFAKIRSQLAEITQEIDENGITLNSAEQQLAALRATAGVDNDDDLVTVATASDEKRKLLVSLDTLEQNLRNNGDGLDIAQLEAEAEASDMDAIDAHISTCKLELEELNQHRDGLRDTRRTLQIRLDEKDGTPLAAAAQEEAQAHLAVIVSDAEQYLRLQMASRILELHIEQYRRQNQAPVLSRAGELFSRLTLGSFAQLRDELDASGRPILLGVRPDNREVPVEGMSSGARDQLYLALRLASLEQHLATSEPMPLILDDILVSFDDHRSRVCLEILAQLATRTQVLLFTHHQRVLDLATGLSSPAGIFSHHIS